MSPRPVMEPYYKKPLPNYDTVPLRFDEINVAAVQMKSTKVDAKDPAPVIKQNVDRICWLIDVAERREQVHLLVFPEFALQGSAIGMWSREDFLRLAVELPGPETEAIGKKCKEYDCYVVCAGMTKEADWPGHFFNTSFIIGPKGNVIHKHWKAHGDPGGAEYATTVHDVLDEFVKRYGWDAVWPVARTDIGNIATFICAEGFIPETARVFGLKGTEVLCRCIAGGNRHYSRSNGGMDPGITMQAYCMGSAMYGIFCDSALITNPEPYSTEDIGCGCSRIWDPGGRQIAEARSNSEQIVTTTIPIASYRKKHSLPVLRQEIYAPVYQQFVGKYPPNLYSKYLPKDSTDAANYARRNARY